MSGRKIECGKIPYTSKVEAWNRIEIEKLRKPNLPLKPYECKRVCGAGVWHVTKNKRGPRKFNEKAFLKGQALSVWENEGGAITQS